MGQLDIVEIFIKDYPFPLSDRDLMWLHNHMNDLSDLILQENEKEVLLGDVR